jgi:hypothetical protein
LKALLENYFKPSIIFLKNFLRRIKFPNAISSASLLAKEMSYRVIYKVFYSKGIFGKYISKTIFVNFIL